MLFHYSDRDRVYRRLRRGAVSLLLFATCPVLAFAQDAPKGPAASSAPADPPQTITEVSTIGLLPEPRLITLGLELAVDRFGDGSGEGKNGFYPEFSNMASGAGFISVGPGYRHNVFNNMAFVDTSAAVSWHFYKMAQGRFEFPSLAGGHLSLGTQAMYQDNTQVNYFGIGGSPVQDDKTQYRIKATEVGGYATAHAAPWFSLGAEVGWLHSPEVTSSGGTFNPDLPDARVVYPADPAMSLAEQPDFIRSEFSVMTDTINAHSHPTRGSQYRAAATTYADRHSSAFSFTQLEAEGLQMVPLAEERVVLALHAWTIFTDPADDHQVPFYLMPSLGGHDTLRAYSSYQFHDLNTLVANVELRLALLTHLDLAPFFDAGSVAARYSDLDFAKTSVGAGVRLHTGRTTIGRLDMAHGSEGWRVVLRTGDPFKLSRVAHRLGPIPFAP